MKKPLAGMLAIITALSLTACGTAESDDADKPDESTTTSQTQTTEEDTATTAEEPVQEPAPVPEPAQSDTGSDFKAYMDSYEAFMNEYVDFMQKYKDGGQPVSMLADYMDMLQKQQEMTNDFNNYDQSQLSDEELQYYLEVQNRVNQKLLSVAAM